MHINEYPTTSGRKQSIAHSTRFNDGATLHDAANQPARLIKCRSFDRAFARCYKNITSKHSVQVCSPLRRRFHLTSGPGFHILGPPRTKSAQSNMTNAVQREPPRPNPSALLVFFLPPSARRSSTPRLLPLPHYFYLLLDTVSLQVKSGTRRASTVSLQLVFATSVLSPSRRVIRK